MSRTLIVLLLVGSCLAANQPLHRSKRQSPINGIGDVFTKFYDLIATKKDIAVAGVSTGVDTVQNFAENTYHLVSDTITYGVNAIGSFLNGNFLASPVAVVAPVAGPQTMPVVLVPSTVPTPIV